MRRPVLSCTAIAIATAASPARAVETTKYVERHPIYFVEVEPHFLAGFDRFGEKAGWGFGGRFSIPIVENGFIPSLNNSVAISFGADVLYPGDVTALDLPLAMQWNFFVDSYWSVFGEPGVVVGTQRDLHALPALWIGGRYHLPTGHVAVTLRIGYPTASIGLSFW